MQASLATEDGAGHAADEIVAAALASDPACSVASSSAAVA